eukprot:1145755-Pelagomonas_calceolata.AAC.3
MSKDQHLPSGCPCGAPALHLPYCLANAPAVLLLCICPIAWRMPLLYSCFASALLPGECPCCAPALHLPYCLANAPAVLLLCICPIAWRMHLLCWGGAGGRGVLAQGAWVGDLHGLDAAGKYSRRKDMAQPQILHHYLR